MPTDTYPTVVNSLLTYLDVLILAVSLGFLGATIVGRSILDDMLGPTVVNVLVVLSLLLLVSAGAVIGYSSK
jgi:hypothetical protein